MSKAEFYFSDLTPEAQDRFLMVQGILSAEEGNYDMDIIPIFTIEAEEEDEVDG